MGIGVVFPGQGVHVPGMGAPWRGQPSWKIVEQAEDVLGEPLAPLLLDAGDDRLSRTREAQLAMFLQGLVVWGALQPTLSEPVTAFAGHSLGQVTALTAAGVLSFDDAIRFVAARAEATQRAAELEPGAMAALLGATDEQAAAACDAAPGECWTANDNAPGHVVVAGTRSGTARAVEEAGRLGVRRVVPLDVGGAFHTPLMQPAVPALRDAAAQLSLGRPTAPVASNEDGCLYSDADGWRERLVDHPVRPVRWRTCTETLANAGIDTFVEVGGKAISALIRRTVASATVHSVVQPADLDTARAGS